MNKWVVVFLLGVCVLPCNGRVPFKPRDGSLPFLVYFASRYRGLCVGTLVSRTAVLTAAVCVTNPNATIKDTRYINVVVGATYRHPRRGIRVQVLKILIPNLIGLSENPGYLMQKSAAVLLLKRNIPDILVEVPLRAAYVDWQGEETLSLQQECLIPGWHFFYKGDKIYPVHKFLLQRNVRAQFMNIVKKNLWCEALAIKFQKGLSNLGFHGIIDTSSCICIRDTDRTAQPCHGMYGAPLICKSRVVAVMMSPDAQWTNCTGHSSMVHLLSSRYLKKFMTCVSSIFDPEYQVEWNFLKKAVYEDYSDQEFDYMPELYDKLKYDTGDRKSVV